MKEAKVILYEIFALLCISLMLGLKSPSTYYQFYMTGFFGFCTVPTYIQFTTNILDAVEFDPITQNSYYITSVWGECPYTVIYKATTQETFIQNTNYEK